MLETAIYVRVSTEEQAQEGFSIRAQEQKLKDYARIKEWAIYKIYRDEGISGKNITARPAINEMIEDIKSGCVKNVLIFKIDRLTRSTVDLANLIDLFNDYNCAFNSLNESIDTQSATGRMFIKIIGIFAEFERENIAERVTLGFERKAREGYSTSSRSTSYGYDRENGQKVQTINEKEAKIVKEIFDMFVNRHMSYCGIRDTLNNRNIPTKENSIWDTRTITSLLKNCNYKGYVRYAYKDEKRKFEVKGLHEPIISEELFNEAQILAEKMTKKVYKKHPKEDHYFAGVLFCGLCGERLMVHGRYIKNRNGDIIHKIDYYCNNRVKKICDAKYMIQKNVEKAFVEYINSIEDFNTLDEIQLSVKQENEAKNLEMITELRKQLEKLDRKEKEIVTMYVQENLDFDSYTNIKKMIDKERNQTILLLKNIEESVDEEIIVKKENIIKSLKENWEKLNNSERRKFLINFVERIEIVNELAEGKREGTIKILNVEFNKE